MNALARVRELAAGESALTLLVLFGLALAATLAPIPTGISATWQISRSTPALSWERWSALRGASAWISSTSTAQRTAALRRRGRWRRHCRATASLRELLDSPRLVLARHAGRHPGRVRPRARETLAVSPIDAPVASRLVRAAGFRDLVAHAYERLDMRRVHEAARPAPRTGVDCQPRCAIDSDPRCPLAGRACDVDRRGF